MARSSFPSSRLPRLWAARNDRPFPCPILPQFPEEKNAIDWKWLSKQFAELARASRRKFRDENLEADSTIFMEQQ